jgi:hypothetical protein
VSEAFYSLLQVGLYSSFCVLRGYSIWHANTVLKFAIEMFWPVYSELTVRLLEVLILKNNGIYGSAFCCYAFNRASSMAFVADF